MNTYFTSDLHLGHKKLSEGTGFTIEEHDKLIKDNIFSIVKRGDRLIIAGDIFWKYNSEQKNLFFSKFRKYGIQVLWAYGNHDKPFTHKALISQKHHLIIKANGQEFFVCHYPMLCWDKSHYGTILVHGHIHTGDSSFNKLKNIQLPSLRMFNVNVDMNNYFPVHSNEIVEKLKDVVGWDYIERK